MPAPDTAVSARHNSVLVVRDAVPADYPAICDVVIAAYRHYLPTSARVDLSSTYASERSKTGRLGRSSEMPHCADANRT